MVGDRHVIGRRQLSVNGALQGFDRLATGFDVADRRQRGGFGAGGQRGQGSTDFVVEVEGHR